MIEIPQCLKKDDIRFLLVKSKEKRPLEPGWQKNPYHYASEKLKQHLANEGNYGVSTGYGNILVLDFDSKEFFETVKDKLPKTLTIKTGSGGIHKYFECDIAPKSFKVTADDKATLMDAQGIGKQVIGPGSLHPNGKFYEVFENEPIAKVCYGEIKSLFKDDLKDEFKPIQRADDGLANKIKAMISVSSMLGEMGCNLTKNPTNCPFHSSKGGKCLSYNDSMGVWHCFHCEKSGDIFNLVMEEKGLKFKEAVFYLAKRFGLSINEMRNDFYEERIEQIKNDENTLKEQLLQLKAMRDTEKSTELLVRFIEKNNHIYTIRSDERPEMYIYHDGIYKQNGRTYIEEITRRLMGDAFTISFCNIVVDKIQNDTLIDAQDFFVEKDEYMLPIMNGVFDLREKKIVDYNPKYRFFGKLPIFYEPGSKMPNIDFFLNDVLASEKDKQTLQEFIGSCLIRRYIYQKSVMMHGHGRNGKGALIRLIKRFFGAENCSEISLHNLEEDQYAKAGLHQKYVNLAGDLSNAALENTNDFKNLTGEDTISANRKYKERLVFKNFAKFICAANELPRTKDLSLAFFDRWLLFDFPFTFLPEEEIKLMDEADKVNVKVRKSGLEEAMWQQSEINGMFLWALEGLERLQKNGSFTSSRTNEGMKKAWLRRSDSLASFCLDHVKDNYEGYANKKEFRKMYNNYCKANKIRTKGDKEIKAYLETNYGVEEIKIDGENTWEGIELYGEIKGIKGINSFSKSASAGSPMTLQKTPPSLDTLDSYINVKEENID